jgi:HPt (histidine-containing phosphotransfer) domain-containing protein
MTPPPSDDAELADGTADLLDLEMVNELRGLVVPGNPNFAEKTYRSFVERAGPMLDELRALMAAGDPQPAADKAHQLKGTAAAIGAVRLQTLMAEIECLGRAGTLEGVEPIVEAASDVLAKTAAQISDVFSES